MWKKRTEGWPNQSSTVIADERTRITESRKRAKIPDGQRFCGLALSGGGIRSAAFAMGVLQGLVRHNRLGDIDYLSSVSGGGYIATSLTWWLTNGCGTSPDKFPFGVRPGTDKPDTRGDRILNYIRQHANYLTPGGGLNSLSLFAVIMRGIFASLFVYFALMIVLMGVLFTLIPEWLQHMGVGAQAISYLLFAAVGLVSLLIVGAILYSVFVGTMVSTWFPMPGYRVSIGVQIRSGRAWAVVLGLLFLATIPWTFEQLNALLSEYLCGKSPAATLTNVTAAIGALMTALTGLSKALHSGNALSGQGKKLIAKVTGISTVAFVLIYGMLLLAYGVSQLLSDAVPDPIKFAGLCTGIAIIVGFFGLVANLNFAGHHRMYRDRLMELFLPDQRNVDENTWAPARGASRFFLANVRTRPYHIINTNVVLVDSKVPRYRGRGGDSFTLSPLYAGSSATGWCSMEDLKMSGVHGMTLSTAMAISGAALNPDTGAAGIGPTRKRLVSMLMTLLNIRLGYWTRGTRRPLSNRANYIFPGIQALLGIGFHERARMIELTDGGHFDNLGLYELIRRRVPIIIVSDAGCDPGFSFNDLSSVIERVRTDFGAIITFRAGRYENLDGLIPSEDGTTEQTRGIKLARRGYAIADIVYDRVPDDPNDRGVLLYIKSTMVAGLPLDVYDYKRKNPAFPDETTADQFFDERQFEAYRELGYVIAKEALTRTGGDLPA